MRINENIKFETNPPKGKLLTGIETGEDEKDPLRKN